MNCQNTPQREQQREQQQEQQQEPDRDSPPSPLLLCESLMAVVPMICPSAPQGQTLIAVSTMLFCFGLHYRGWPVLFSNLLMPSSQVLSSLLGQGRKSLDCFESLWSSSLSSEELV